MKLDLAAYSAAERATFTLRALYEQAGWRKYRCSRFEEYALYQQYQRFLSDAQVVTFTDLDGKLRAIKPDVTLSIAKNAQPAPGECKRYYYNEEVCRPSRESHTFQTIHQMGLESMGAVDDAEQAQVVRLALQSLAALEVPTVLEVSHMGYVTGLLDAIGAPASVRPALLEQLRDKTPTACTRPRWRRGSARRTPPRCATCSICMGRWGPPSRRPAPIAAASPSGRRWRNCRRCRTRWRTPAAACSWT